MKQLDKFELHDALIHRTNIDYPKKSVVVELAFYPNPGASSRTNAEIHFSGVSSISHSGDFGHLADNASAGNVNYWAPAEKGGTTFIYLVNGVLSVTAKKVVFKVKR